MALFGDHLSISEVISYCAAGIWDDFGTAIVEPALWLEVTARDSWGRAKKAEGLKATFRAEAPKKAFDNVETAIFIEIITFNTLRSLLRQFWQPKENFMHFCVVSCLFSVLQKVQNNMEKIFGTILKDSRNLSIRKVPRKIFPSCNLPSM